jgi:hypothetical protein
MGGLTSPAGRHARALGLFGVLLLVLACLATADPMGSVQGGGTVRLDAEHPTISLDRERLVFEPLCDAVRVTAELEFHNHGSACEVPMGFPLLVWHPGSGQDFVKDFTVEVDGTPLEASKDEEGRAIELGGKPHWCEWHRFDVPFEAGATRTMTVSYEEHPANALRPQVPYVLATGGTWKGTIRDFELQVRLGDRRNFHGIQLTGDDQPLPYEQQGSTLIWRCADYAGKPEVLWFRVEGAPASVTVNGTSARPEALPVGEASCGGQRYPVVWYDGKLLTKARFLAEVVMASWKDLEDSRVLLSKEGTDIELTAIVPPMMRASEGRAYTYSYVDPDPAFRAFGGAVTEERDERGDAWVAITAPPNNAASARQTALCPDQRYEYRLRCLRALAAKWPAELAEVARELCGREQEHPVVLLAVLGHLADNPPSFAAPESILPRMELPQGKEHLDVAMRYVILSDEAVVRGAALTLAHLDARANRDRLIDWLINGQLTTRHGAPQIGLALRAMGVDGTCQAIIDAVRDAGKGARPKNGAMALGYLGDDDAVPFLMDVVRGRYGSSWGMIWSGTSALEVMGTQSALEACAQLAEEYADSHKICFPLVRSLERAVTSGPSAEWSHLSPPPWGGGLSPAEARRIVLPLAERLKDVLPASYEASLAAIIKQAALAEAGETG